MAYYVLGSGGAKYGPVDVTVLNGWIAANRVGPETLVEDTGSGVKLPARAVPGVIFSGPHPSPNQPVGANSALNQPQPQSTTPRSTYVRPGWGTGGGKHNLFLPNADSKWHWQSAACAAVTLLLGAFLGLTHWYIGRFTYFAIIIPLAGIQRGSAGFGLSKGLSTLLVTLNIIAMLASAAFCLRDLIL